MEHMIQMEADLQQDGIAGPAYRLWFHKPLWTDYITLLQAFQPLAACSATPTRGGKMTAVWNVPPNNTSIPRRGFQEEFVSKLAGGSFTSCSAGTRYDTSWLT